MTSEIKFQLYLLNVNDIILIKLKQGNKWHSVNLDFENNFANNHITTVIAHHTTKHQNNHICKFVFGCPLVNITCSKWQQIQNQGQQISLKEFKVATPNKNLEFVESFCQKIHYYEDAFFFFLFISLR